MRVAYLTTEYPKVSHSFIRREIEALEARGLRIERFAIRGTEDPLRDVADIAEQKKTYVCLEQGPAGLLRDTLGVLGAHPKSVSQALWAARSMAGASDRGYARHGAYLVEAAHLVKECQRRAIDHVHVHFGTNSATVALLMRKMGGPPFSMTVHGPNEFDQAIGWQLGRKVEAAAFVAAISSYCRGQLQRWSDPGCWDRIHIVHCAVNEVFLEAPPSRPTDVQKLVCVGRLSAQKGQLLLLRSFAKVARAFPKAELVLGGDGELRGPIEREVERLGLGGRVQITGWIDEATVREHILGARAMVLPSYAEGLPVVIMEALALGRPVVSTMVAGIPELVRPGQTGWLVPAGDEGALEGALREVLSASPPELEALGEKGRVAVRQSHSAATEAEKLHELFLRYAGGPGS